MFAQQDAETQAKLQHAAAALEELPDDRPEHIRAKELAFRRHEDTPEYHHRKRLADTWCAAFVIRKHFPPIAHDPRFASTEPSGLSQRHLNDLATGRSLPPELAVEAERVSRQYDFFHWHLAFPEVFAKGGFDCVLGNPPWERVKIQEKEWFAERRPDIANTTNASVRKRLIEALRSDDPVLEEQFRDASRLAEGESHLLRTSNLYPLCGRGDINLYAVFAERMRDLLNNSGRIGVVLPTGIATDDTTKFFFQDLVQTNSLVTLLDFQSGPGLFGDIGHARFKFCLFTTKCRANHPKGIVSFAFFLRGIEQITEPGRLFTLNGEDIAHLNPNSLTCPIFRDARDATITKVIYSRVQVLKRTGPRTANPWDVQFLRMFDMTNDSKYFYDEKKLSDEKSVSFGNRFSIGPTILYPLYEAKMFHQFNHRFGDYGDYPEEALTSHLPDIPSKRLEDPFYAPKSRYWIAEELIVEALRSRWSHKWFIAYRWIARSSDERTLISSVVPFAGFGNSSPVIFLGNAHLFACAGLVSNLSAFVFDYSARQKLGGANMTFGALEQLPVLPPSSYCHKCDWDAGAVTLRDWLLPRVLELTYTAWDLEAFAQDCGSPGPPFRWNEERRFLLRCELDAAFFHLYLGPETEWRQQPAALTQSFPTPRAGVSYILDTFPIVRRKDEAKFNGDYRTKRVILEIYDAMQESIRTGQPYQTRLDPPPADPRCCHPPRATES